MQFIQASDVCQRYKAEHVHLPGLLQPLPIPRLAWTHVTMDFIESLPNSQGYDTIMVVIDRLTKVGHFIALSHPFSAKKVAQLFLDSIFRLHGLPESIVTDRDRIFTSTFWQELFRLVGTDLHYSSAYHPQSDGQSERLNQCVESYLRCMTGEFPTRWSSWLAMAEWWYNSSYHSSLQLTPFEALYGYKPVPLPLGPYVDTIIPAAAQLLQERMRISGSLKDHLTKAQQRMKFFADQQRTERSFAVGDWVFLKLQPYRQQTVAIRKCLKLAARFYGPFQVEAKVGSVAYRLRLPAGARIHPVFHVSLLKKKIGPVQQVSGALPEFDNADQCPLQPESVLQRRAIMRNGQPVIQFLIKWYQLEPEEASWEDQDFIHSQFPHFQS